MNNSTGVGMEFDSPDFAQPPPTKIINQLSMWEAVAVTAVTNFIAVAGAAGNVLNVIILRDHGLNNSTNIILLSLAVADLLFLITSPMRNVSNYIRVFDKGLAITVEAYVFGYAMILNSIFSVSSMTHIVIISIERLLAIFFPFQVSRWVTPYRMTIIAVCAHAIWYPVWVPLLFRTEIKWLFNPLVNQTVAIPAYSQVYTDNIEAFENFYNYFLMMFTGPGYSAIVLCCCLATGIKLFIVSKKRAEMAKGMQKENARDGVNIRAVRMLIVVCLFYFVSTLPPSLFQVLQVTGNSVYIDEAKSYSTVLLWCINSSANFVIYVFMSAKFKATFKAMLPCRKAA